MNCPLCNYMMTDFDAECSRCHGKGIAHQPLHTQPAPAQSPIVATITEQDLDNWTKKLEKTIHYLKYPVSIFLICVFLVQPALEKYVYNKPAASPLSPPQVTVSQKSSLTAPDSATCGAMDTDECAWVQAASKIMSSSLHTEKRPGESMSANLTKLEAAITQAQSDFTRLPFAPPCCVRARTLTESALSEAWMAVRSAKIANDFNTEATVKTAQERKQRAAEIYGEAAAEFQRLYNSPE